MASSAAETIAAAIEKLEALRDSASPGHWDYAGQGWVRNGDPSVGSDQFPECLAATTNTDEDGELIVTLHRTIDAQLAILQHGLQGARDQDNYNINAADEPQAVLDSIALARAILGES